MNCRDWEERLALYAGGDLAPDEAAEVERHLGECPGCQMFASGLKESLEMLRESHRERPVPGAFRGGAGASAGGSGTRPASFVAAGMGVWLGVGGRGAACWRSSRCGHPEAAGSGRCRHPPAALGARAGSRQEAAGITWTARRPGESPRHQRRAPVKAQPGEPIVVRMVTDNPDVVIYWIAETRGE